MCDVRVGVAQHRYYTFYGRGVFAGCRTAGDVDLLTEQPLRLVYQ